LAVALISIREESYFQSKTGLGVDNVLASPNIQYAMNAPNDRPYLSILISTLNRSEFLSQLLDALVAQEPVPGSFEIVVVDNGSTDQTPEVLRDYATRYPRVVRSAVETRRGISVARNQALEMARGEIVAFIDDDALPEPNWALETVRGFRNANVGVVGGPIHLLWYDPCPAWISQRYLSVLGHLELGPHLRILRDRTPFGGNIAFRRDALRELRGFRTFLGIQAGKLVVGEEILACLELRKRGYLIVYNPAMAVRHRVSSSRLNRTFFLNYFRGLGYSEAIIYLHGNRWRFATRLVKRSLFSLVVHPVLWLYYKAISKPDKSFGHLLEIRRCLGYYRGILAAPFVRQGKIRAQTNFPSTEEESLR
ncbi:MAG: glycosyltransferase, partial [bacterium]